MIRPDESQSRAGARTEHFGEGVENDVATLEAVEAPDEEDPIRITVR